MKNASIERLQGKKSKIEKGIYMEEKIKDFIIHMKYDHISLIDISTQVLTVYKMGKVFELGGLKTEVDYDTSVRFIRNKMVYPEDQKKFDQQFFSNLIEVLSQKGEFIEKYRLFHEDTKSYRWTKVVYRYFENSKNFIIQLSEDIHSDMLAQKKIELDNEKLMLQDKCFKLLSEHTNKVLVEWDFDKEQIMALSDFSTLFEGEEATAKLLDNILTIESVYEKEQVIFKTIFKTIASGNPVTDARFRIIDDQGNYHWCSLSGIVLKDSNGDQLKAIGMLESIAEQLNKEEFLRKQAERDQLTGLYNKTTTEHIIKTVLRNSNEYNRHILMVIDIDNYKNINDHLGHLYGDIVLKQLAMLLKAIFRENDIVGRLGGDEFFVFIENDTSKEFLIKKASEICRVFNRTYSEGTKHETISASVGISIYPEHGTSFEQLYKHADIALYSVKSNKKNDFKVYNNGMNMNYVSDRTDIDKTSKTQNSFKENRVEYIFRLLYESENIEENIDSALQFIAEQFDFSRGYIFETDSTGNFTSNTFEWCAQGISPEIDSLQNVPIHIVATAHNSFIEKSVFIIENVKNMPKDEREILERQGIISMFQFGMMKKGMPIGFVGFDDCTYPHTPTEDEIEELKLICNVFATFLTKQRASERAQENYDAMLSVLNNAEGYTYVIDKDQYEVLFENENTRAVVGESSIGKHCYEEYMNNDSPCKECPINGVSDQKPRHTVEISNASLGVFSRTSASRVRWVDHKENYLITSVDVTEYKKQEVSHETQLRELLNLTKIGLWDWDLKTGSVIYSEMWANILGYTKDELPETIETWKNMIILEDVAYAEKLVQCYLDGEISSYEVEFRMLHKNGTIVWIQDKGHISERDEVGNPLRFIGVFQDVSHLKDRSDGIERNL